MNFDPPPKEISDTPERIEQILIEGYRRMTPEQKMERVEQAILSARQLALARIRQQYPDATEKDNMLRLASLWIDRDIMIKRFGWDPEKEGY